jgi:hypothetical protein
MSSRSKKANAAGGRAFAACESPSVTCLVGLTPAHEQILSDYPELTEDDIRACLAFGAEP